MHVNFGLMPPLEPPVRNKRERAAAYAARGSDAMAAWVESVATLGISDVRARVPMRAWTAGAQ
jgi:methylenetetrahydrofolate--tRNA-(uracil-5-)-methyltransferase